MPHRTSSTDSTQVHHIRPSSFEALSEETFKFTSNDYLPSPAIWVPVVLHFAVPNGEQKAVAEQLRAGLESTLAQCRHLTGTIEDAGNGDYCMVARKDSSVQFIEHVFDSSEVSSHEELAACNFATSKLGNLSRWSVKGMVYDPMNPTAATKKGAPVLGIQANFIPGGMAIVINMHHWVMDFAGLASFIYQWAGNTKALQNGAPLPGMSPESLERSRLDVQLPGLTEVMGIRQSSSAPPSDKQSNGNATSAIVSPTVKPKPVPVTICMFHLSKSKAAGLKELATSPSGPWISTYDACAAFWYRILARYRAKAYKADESAPAPFSQLVNIRSKLSPPLPAMYMGNAIVPVTSDLQSVQLTIKEVADSASLAAIAAYIRRLTTSVDEPYIWETLETITRARKEGKPPMRKVGAIPPFKTTDWRAPNVCEADFGFGKATALRHLLGVAPSVTIYPYREVREDQEEVMEFAVPVETAVLEKLLEDEEVKKWFGFKGEDIRA